MYVTLPVRLRTGLLLGATLVGLASVAIPAAAAPSYPWCARYSTTGGECSFYTREQCMETLSGIGGSCTQNPGYTGPAASDTGPYNSALRSRRHH
jgi:Protein of unknown function (DUF3551)